MSRAEFKRFATDESGGGTVMGLFWFILLVGICGMAVDVTDGFRARTMLQATADSAALAAAVDLPNSVTAVSTAVSYAYGNMKQSENGTVLRASDVHVGLWNGATKSLDRNAVLPDAVMVTVHRSAAKENALPVNFLRMIGQMNWNVTAQAVAQRFIPPCLRDGLVARETVDISSNNSFVNKICIHGQQGVKIQSNNYFEPGVNVSMPEMPAMLQLPSSGMASNPGLQSALRESSMSPRDVNHVDEIMLNYLDPNWSKQPSYIDKSKPVIVVDEKFDLSTVEQNRIYSVECKPNKNAIIPSNMMVRNVVIIADCELKINSGAFIYNAVLGSRSGGNGSVSKANVAAAANVQLGLPDNCAPGGGVQIFSNATIQTAASTGIDGVQMIAAGDLQLGARDQGINGISAQSGGKITLTSNNQFGLCSGGAPYQFVAWYYRLVL